MTPRYVLERNDFESIHEPIKPEGQDNAYDVFRPMLEARYGVYVFQVKPSGEEAGSVLYVGGGGIRQQENSKRDILDRVEQQYQVDGSQLTGQTFYKNWCERKKTRASESQALFLRQFREWRLTTFTTEHQDAIPLVEVAEKMLIYFLRPAYNKPYPVEGVAVARSLDQVDPVVFRGDREGFKCVVHCR